jgi:hypothetical protein
MMDRLREFHSQHPDADAVASIKHHLANPLRPQNEKGRLRPHPLIVLPGAIGLIAIVSFIYFSYFQS